MSRQRNSILSIVMAFLVVILLVQLWLLVGALEAYAAGQNLIGLPVALASGICLMASAWLVHALK
jgi:hypothetical protein